MKLVCGEIERRKEQGVSAKLTLKATSDGCSVEWRVAEWVVNELSSG